MHDAKRPKVSSASVPVAVKIMARRRSLENIERSMEEAFDLPISPYKVMIGIPLNSSHRPITPTMRDDKETRDKLGICLSPLCIKIAGHAGNCPQGPAGDRSLRQWLSDKQIGEPKPTSTYTVEQLRRMGMVGVYRG